MKVVRWFLSAVLVFTIIFSVARAEEPDSVFIRANYTKMEVMIPMRDGVRLFTSIYAPKDSSTKHPVMLTRTPYSCAPYGVNHVPAWEPAQKRMYFRAGYIIVTQDVRGRFMSEGEYENVRPVKNEYKGNKDIDETTDTYDTVDWLVKHLTTCNGNVGIEGISYPGFYSWMGAIHAHPAVKAVSPQAPVSQWMSGDDFFHNGAFLLPHAFDFFYAFGKPRPTPTKAWTGGINHVTPDGYKFFLDLGPLPNANRKYYHDSISFWNDIIAHGTWDSFWAERSVLPHLKNIRPATMVVGGWFDSENLYGALNSYKTLEKNEQTGSHTIVMGPWSHGQWAWDGGDSLGYVHWNSKTAEFYRDSIEFPFFNYYLNGVGSPKKFEAAVFMTGADEWRFEETWPPKNVEQTSFYLQPNGGLAMTVPGKSKPEFDEYVNDPKKPVPYTSEITQWYNRAFPVEDQRFAERRPDVLVYRSDELKDDLTVAGPIVVDFFISTSGTDCDWIVKVIDVWPDTMQTPNGYPNWVKYGGYEMMVRGDVLRGKFRNSTAKPEPFVPNKVTPISFTMNDVFHRFKKGHRIMIQVQSSWFPMIDLNPGKFVDIYHATETDFRKTTQRVYHTAGYPSHITVNLMK